MTAGTELRRVGGLLLAVVLAASSPLVSAEPIPVFPKDLPATDEPVWRQPVDDWAGARQRVTTDPAWRDWFDAKRAQVEAWMAQRRDRVEWVAGWGHEFVSPRDGSYLTFTPEVPDGAGATLASPSDPAVVVTPTIFRAWVTKFRGRHMITVKDAAIIGRLTGEPRYAAWVAEQLDFYAEHWAEWPLQDRFYGPSRLFAQPLMDAAYLNHLLEAARLVRAEVEPARWARWRDELFRPQAELLGRSMQRVHNIACYLRAAAAQVGLACGDEALWREAIDGEWGLRRQLADGVTGDFLWFEQSIGYHEFALAGILPLLEEVAAAGRGSELAREMAIVRAMLLAPNALRFPDNRLPNPADNAALRLREAPLRQVLRRAYRVLPTPLGLAEAHNARTWQTLLEPPETIGPVDEAVDMVPVTSRHFAATRFAQLKAQGWQVFFHYGQLTASHAQAELLNFEAYFGDTPITHDPHTVGYGSPLHREWFTRGLCHNVPLVDGRGSAPPPEDGDPRTLPQRGEAVVFDPTDGMMAARQPAYRDGVTAERTLRIVNGALHDEVRVTATDGTPRKLGLALHLQARIESNDTLSPAPDFASGRPAAFGYWRDVVRGAFEDEAVFTAQCPDGRRLEVRFAVPGPFTVSVGSVPDAPVPARRMAFYLETEGAETIFRTTLTPVQ